MVSWYELVVLSLLLHLLKGSIIYDESYLNFFTVPATSTLTVSPDVYKHGSNSLKWTWQKGDALELDLHHDPIDGRNALKRGGVKFWLYLVQGIPGKMTLSFYTTFFVYFWKRPAPECQFDISLEFRGWRAIWVTFEECRLGSSTSPLYRMELRAPAWYDGEVYVDLLRIVRKNLRRQTRDHVVPPIRGRVSSAKNFWQQTYRWSRVQPAMTLFNEIDLSDEQLEKLRDIRLIRTRLTDWYRDGGKSTYDFTGHFRSRWSRLKATMKRARELFKTLNITRTEGFLKGPPLFSRNSEYGNSNDIRSPELKFGYVMREVLMPLSLEHFFFTRKQETRRIVEEELHRLNDAKLASQTVHRLLGRDKELIAVFLRASKLGVRPLTRSKLRLALKAVNQRRFLRIRLLFEYIMDQGWAVGSALGSLDHEMNRSSKGFVLSVLLLRRPLRRAGLLPRIVRIMRWYLEFGELYQQHYEFTGTTADRMRTLTLYRLVCVLVMPETTLQEAFEKLRDMDALRDWYENAVHINPAMGGVIKPDYIGYHHKAFYPNDYVLPALLAASHVVYLLRGTKFELGEVGRSNLRNAINFMRILSVKYSIPNSVTNTDPTVAKPELICLIPAFAYMTLFEHGSRDRMPTPRAMSTTALASLRAFLRLLDESDRHVRAYLASGKGCSWKTNYFDTLGSLSLILSLRKFAVDHGIAAEGSPAGNWAKNFAALAIHRRGDWAVTAKGFNNFVWGHESSRRGNRYGLYQSYGQLLIANSEQAMKAHDIDRGWDWTRLPGTTTLRVPPRELVRKRSRFYNPEELCGAVSFQGTSPLRNGAFVMNFKRPDYGPALYGQTDLETQFSFKKSVFFYDELLVCLGSDISARRNTPVEVETTLFQNIGIIGDQVHSIQVNGFEVLVQPSSYSNRLIWATNSAATLMDVNGNGYYVPKAGAQNLIVWLGNQSSYSSKLDKMAHGHFATALLKHGANPNGLTYEYSILVNTSAEDLYDFSCRQEKLRGLPKYEVLLQGERAHVVKFNNAPRQGVSTYAYSVFSTEELPGPLWMVGDPCVIMAEDGGSAGDGLIIGLSYPQMNFNTTRKWRTADDVDTEDLFYTRSHAKRVFVLLRRKVRASGYTVYVDGKLVDPEEAREHVRVIPMHKEEDSGLLVNFVNLLNGFTTEVHLRRIPNINNEA